jgi:uncharacterized heparinase superfamily protein
MEFLKYFHTIRYLKASQLLGRVRHRLVRPKVDTAPAPAVRHRNGQWTFPACRVPSMLGVGTFRFLNETRTLQSPQDWNNPEAEKLWLYNLHYFDDLNAKSAADRREWHEALLLRWVFENPPGTGNGWEPYPSSLRIVNWIKWALAGNVLTKEVVHSLAVQVRFLTGQLEDHLLGNHLFANAKALVFGGAFFQGQEAENWMRMGLDLLMREIPEQILPDGGQFERSPMYHALALEDMCDLINILCAYPESVPDAYSSPVSTWPGITSKMADWLGVMCHPDGEIALFNDAAFGIAPKPERLFEYCAGLGIHGGGKISKEKHSCVVTHLNQTGYIRVEQDKAVAFLDTALVGPDYLPGHAHADTLNFELSLFEKRVIVDSGTSCYGLGAERLRQRTTSAHNTVVVEGQDSSEVWSGFRVARRAYPRNLSVRESEGEGVVIFCEHDGYRRLSGKPVHARTWSFTSKSLVITDEIKGYLRSSEARFHLHPGVRCEMMTDNELKLSVDGIENIIIRFSAPKVVVQDSTYHPGFGISIDNACLSVFFNGVLKTEVFWE